MKIASAESISTHSKYLTFVPQLEKTWKKYRYQLKHKLVIKDLIKIKCVIKILFQALRFTLLVQFFDFLSLF